MRSNSIKHGIYNVGTGINTSFNEVIQIIDNILGTDVTPTCIKCPIKNYVKDTMADVSLARAELGYEPEWEIEEGIKKIAVAANLRDESTDEALNIEQRTFH
jgi:nucleoside-diphosphate-sugar epimerase